jgi:hypothetical protein
MPVRPTEFVGVTEEAPQLSNPRHQFVARLLAEQSIEIVALPQIESFAERLRPRLN